MSTGDVVALRREFHQHPEVGFAEIRTAARVIAELTSAGFTVRTGDDAASVDGLPGLPDAAVLDDAAVGAREAGIAGDLVDALSGGRTAVIGELAGDRDGPLVALRFDMDALPLTEAAQDDHFPFRSGFVSARPGVMHACGHDGHVAIGIALARSLADKAFPGRVRLVFQPAEEGVRGARPMVAAGAMDGVDVFYALHLGMGLPVGTIAPATVGRFATRKLLARFTGLAAHASGAPEHGRNALLAAATAALSVQGLPRFSTADTRVNVGRLHAGTAPNIVAADAEMAYEVRSGDVAVVEDLDERARRMCRAAGEMHGVDVAVLETGAADNADCDPGPSEAVAAAARGIDGVTDVPATWPALGSDDATIFMSEVQRAGGVATYLGLGSGDFGPHHSAHFDVDERALPIGVELLDRVVRAGSHGR
jgi:aminobenzoyl-glutamate utilization protein A